MSPLLVISIYLSLYYLLCKTTSIECEPVLGKTYGLDGFHTIMSQTTVSYCGDAIIERVNHHEKHDAVHKEPSWLELWVGANPKKIFVHHPLWGYMEPNVIPLIYTVVGMCLLPILFLHLIIVEQSNPRKKRNDTY